MCGIAGFILGAKARIDSADTLRRMTGALIHRGPDGSGCLLERDAQVGLGHRRLAIVDLSDAGRQPMVSRAGRYVITFNGEVYNFERLRRMLEPEKIAFRGHSDTEVMLAAIESWGVEAAVKKFEGMFAFALWDRQEQEMWLVRDRLGKKPLYFGFAGDSLVFGSELRALRRFPGFDASLDRNALTLLLRHNYIPAPWSVYASVGKVRPGTLKRIKIRSGAPVEGEEICYWSAQEAFERGRNARFAGGTAEAVSQLDALLRAAVADRMVADVPLGAFLSGGIDSSTVVALMQAQSSKRVRTFSIGFHEAAYNEAQHAAAVAKHLGTDHTEIYLTPAEALAVVPSLPTMFDEPFSDSSQIPTYLVSKIARQHVTVALSGDGGDELFCGYPRYHRWRKVWSTMQWMPSPIRHALAKLMRGVSIKTWNSLLGPAMRLRGGGAASAGDKLHKLGEALSAVTPEMVYMRFLSHWMHPADVVIGGVEPATILSAAQGPTDVDGFTEHMMLLDVLTYLPDDILAKADRASMAVSLETRGPLLDHRVVEWAAALPLNFKLRDGTDKWVLRQVLARYAPPALFARPKMGFGVPIDSWLRGPLREWAEDLLSKSTLEADGILRAAPIRQMWEEFIGKDYPWHYPLWDVLMFQSWFHGVHRARD